jgi:hypothetical protein
MGTFLLWFHGDTFNVVQHSRFVQSPRRQEPPGQVGDTLPC